MISIIKIYKSWWRVLVGAGKDHISLIKCEKIEMQRLLAGCNDQSMRSTLGLSVLFTSSHSWVPD